MPGQSHNPARRAPSNVSGDLEQSIRRLGRLASAPRWHVAFEVGGEASDVRTITLRVRDIDGRDTKQQFSVRLWVSTSADGGPAAGQTITFSSGTILVTVTANQFYEVLTTADGQIILNVTVAGAGSRWIRAHVAGEMFTSNEALWAA